MADDKGIKTVDKKDDDLVPAKPAEELVTDEMKESAVESAKLRNQKRAETPSEGGPKLRRQGGKGPDSTLYESDIKYPVDVHGDDFEFYGPMGMHASIPEGVEVQPYASEQEFVLDEEAIRTLKFTKPGRNLPKKRLYNIKAIHKDGRIVQLPAEPQIQNNAGGDPEDAIGLNRYRRKGIHLLIDWTTLIPTYCAAWDCWAQAAATGPHVGFCSLRHAKHTLPNAYKGVGDGATGFQIQQGLMEAGVTTSAVWEA